MDFFKNIAWWVWLIIAGLLGVIGYGVYYYISKNALAKTSEDVENGTPDAPDAPEGDYTPDAPQPKGSGNDTPKTDDTDITQTNLPVRKLAANGAAIIDLKLADIGLYKIRFSTPRQKSAQIQYVQNLLRAKKFLSANAKSDGILGPVTWAAIVKAFKANGITIGNGYNGNLYTVASAITKTHIPTPR